MFIRTLKSKIFLQVTADASNSYLDYLDSLIDEYNNTYHHFVGKKLVDADYSTLPEEIVSHNKIPNVSVDDRVRITRYKNILVKIILNISQEKYFLLVLCWIQILGLIWLNFWMLKENQGVFMRKNYCWVDYEILIYKLLSRTRKI